MPADDGSGGAVGGGGGVASIHTQPPVRKEDDHMCADSAALASCTWRGVVQQLLGEQRRDSNLIGSMVCTLIGKSG